MKMKSNFIVIYKFACIFAIEGFVTRFDALLKVLNCHQKPILIFRHMFSQPNFMQRKRVKDFLIFERRLGYELSDWSEKVLILLTYDVIDRSIGS